MQDYSLADLKRLFGLPPALVRRLSQAGFIAPATSKRGKNQYSFQDLLVLRVAGALKAARISTPKIVEALEQIRSALPSGRLPAIALAASGKDLAVREGFREWEASGQYALPLMPAAAQIAELRRHVEIPAESVADQHFTRGHLLEESDVAAARAAYLAALSVQEDHLEARINLGRLLHMDGQLKEAEKLYRQAKTSSALLSFNLAILLEDLEREEEAIAAYREALAQDPMLCDAHYNLSRLHERANRPREALRHLLAYRRHIDRYGE